MLKFQTLVYFVKNFLAKVLNLLTKIFNILCEEVRELANDRQIPKRVEYCSRKEYNDIMYGYLQSISKWSKVEGEPRYVDKKDINFSKLGETLNISRQTASKKFKDLMSLGLIKQSNDKYLLTILPPDYAHLIQEDTLKILVAALNDNAISTYVYLFNRYFAAKGAYLTTLDQIKIFLGLSTKTRSNNETIVNILKVLAKLGLVEYHLTNSTNAEGEYITIYSIDKVYNQIKC